MAVGEEEEEVEVEEVGDRKGTGKSGDIVLALCVVDGDMSSGVLLLELRLPESEDGSREEMRRYRDRSEEECMREDEESGQGEEDAAVLLLLRVAGEMVCRVGVMGGTEEKKEAMDEEGERVR